MKTIGKGCDNFITPPHLWKQLDKVFRFTLDAACTSGNQLFKKGFCYDLGQDGLLESWRDEIVFCNPPFSKKKEWIIKANYEVLCNGCPIAVMVLPTNSMSSEIWHNLIIGKFYYEILNKRVMFLDPETKEPTNGNNSGTTLVYFMNKILSKPN